MALRLLPDSSAKNQENRRDRRAFFLNFLFSCLDSAVRDFGEPKTAKRGLILAPAGPVGGLADPAGQAGVVGRVVLVDIEIAHEGILGGAGRRRAQLGAAEESDFDVPG